MRAGPTERFTGRVADYARHRPSFPEELLDALPEGVLAPGAVAADVGSGTGIFSRQLARRTKFVWCVEPNAGMREHSESYLSALKNVRVVEGTAEATGLPDACVDVITAAQAFHWFDRPKARTEFLRILKPGGWVVLLWYIRVTTGDPFLEGYEALLQRYSIDYREVDHRNITPAIVAEFFSPAPVSHFEAPLVERMTIEEVRGRIASSSYAPTPAHPNHAPLLEGVAELFSRHASGATVEFRYVTTADAGRLASASR